VQGGRLRLLGGVSLKRPDGNDGTPGPRKSRALLGYLALNPDGATRDRIAGLLWGDAPETQARASLRQCLSAIRRGLGDAAATWLQSTGDRVRLTAPGLRIDARELLGTAPDAELEQVEEAIASYRGPLLEGLGADEAPFEHWRQGEQQQIREALHRLVVAAIEGRRQRGDEDAALRLGLGLVNADWTNEAAHRLVMEGYARTGQLATARAQFRRFKEQLAARLGTQPSPETTEVFRSLDRIADRARGEPSTPQPSEDATELRRRQVSAWFVRLADGIVRSPEARHAELSLLWEAARSVASAHGADESFVESDGLLALWGTKTARGDEAERAMAAAEMLQTRLAANDVVAAPSIGVASGLAVPAIGVVPPWIGDVLADARRLAASATAGTTTPCPQTRAGLRRDAPRAPLVGREIELLQLDAHLQGASSHGRGAIVVLRGEAGVGKTRLCEEAVHRAEERGMHVVRLHVSGSGEGDQVDFARSMARRLCAVLRPEGEGEGDVDVAAALGPERHTQLAALLGLPLDAHAAAVESALDPDGRDQQRRSTLLELLDAVLETGPLLWLLEDVHWATGDELAGLADLLDAVRSRKILCMMTVRSENEPDSEAWRAATVRRGSTTLTLLPLEREAAFELASRLGSFSPAQARALADKAGGNPLFLEQLARGLDNASAGSEIPATIQALIVGRLDREPTATREAVELASVAGQRMAMETLRALVGDEQAKRLREAAWIEPDGREARFAHALLRDAVYSSIHAERRQQLHRRVAEHYGEANHERRAEHLAAAGDPAAASAFLAAAQEAVADARLAVALVLLARGRAVGGEAAIMHALAVLAGDLQRQLGHREDAMASYAIAEQHATNVAERLAVLLGEAETLAAAERADEAFARLDTASQLLDTEPSDLWMARVATLRGNFFFPQGDYAACAGAHGQALTLARRAKSVPDIARAMLGLGDAEFLRGNVARSAELFAEAGELAATHDLLRHEAAAHGMRGWSLLYCLRLDEAEAALRAGTERAAQLANKRLQNVAHSGLLALHLTRGNPKAAEAECETVVELVRQFGGTRFEVMAYNYLAQARLQRGELGDTHQELLALRERAAGQAERFWLPALLAGLAATTNDERERVRRIEEALDLCQHCPLPSRAPFYPLAIESALRDRNWPLLDRLTKSLEAFAAEHPFAWAQLVLDRAGLLRTRARDPDREGLEEEIATLNEQATSLGIGDPLLTIPAGDA